MEQKQRLYIYDRKEMVILVFLGVLVAAFAFTLGVHLGKRVVTSVEVAQPGEPKTTEMAPDSVPSKHDLQEQHKAAQAGVEENLNQALHEEVVRTGIKLDTPRQVDLPGESKKSAKSEAKGESHAAQEHDAKSEPEKGTEGDAQETSPKKELARILYADIAATRRTPPEGRFTLQVGSYNNLSEAKDQVDAMEALGLKPVLRAADIRGRGRWYRIFLGGFPSQSDAERAGGRYRNQHAIESFIVSKMID